MAEDGAITRANNEVWLPGPQRFRVLVACDPCRRRKTKCDGTHPDCGACLSRRLQCSWPFGPYSITPAPGSTSVVHSRIDLRSSRNLYASDGSRFESRTKRDTAQSSRLLAHALDIFYSRHHHTEFCSFFHVPSLDIQQLQREAPFLAHSLFALSAIYFNHSTAQGAGFATAAEMSEWHSNMARQYSRESVDSASVIHIQANLILALRDLLCRLPHIAWTFTGIAIRQAQTLRLGREYHSRVSNRQKEVQRRTYWACFIMDRLVSYTCWRPQSIDFDCVRLNLPSPEQTFTFEESFDGPRMEQLPSPYDFSRLGLLPFFLTVVHLWGQVAYLQTKGGRRHVIEASVERSASGRLIEKIEELHKAMPPGMQWSAQNRNAFRHVGQAALYVRLHLLLSHARCLLAQEYLSYRDVSQQREYVDDQEEEAARAVRDEQLRLTCIDVSTATVEQLAELDVAVQSSQEALQSPFTGSAILTAANIQCWIRYVAQDGNGSHVAAEENLRRLQGVLEAWRCHWPLAEAWLDTLSLLRRVYETTDTAYSQVDWAAASATRIVPGATSAPLSVSLTEGRGLPEMGEKMVDKIRFILLSSLEDLDARTRVLQSLMTTTAVREDYAISPTAIFDFGLSEDVYFGFPDISSPITD